MLVKVAIDLALDRLFTYTVPEELKKKLAVGQLLSVSFGHRQARGFALEICSAEKDEAGRDFTLKDVSAIVDEVPFFSPELLALVKRIAAYTASPVEAVLKAALPAAVLKRNVRPRELIYVEPAESADVSSATERQRWLYEQIVRLGGGWMGQLCRELKTAPATLKALGEKGFVTVGAREKRRDPLSGKRILPTRPLPLNDGQASALEKISSAGKPLLLFGITGSGKTEVYLQAIARELEAGRGAIVMVPEISLTPQTVQRFASRFGDKVAVLHSALSDGERYDEWHRIRSGAAKVVIGPRSAVFAPVRGLGLIVVDEEHDTSYKQDETPRYHARDVAVLRASIEGARVVLGSATPSLESWLNVSRGKYEAAVMSERAGAGTLPHVRLVNMTEGEKGVFSRELLDAVALRLDRGEQTILFLNRRGYARSVTCGDCGYVMECPDCSLPYTYHQADDCLRCHICGGWSLRPAVCPQCRSKDFSYTGIGTQRAETALGKCFPRARILRMDADSTSRKHSHDDILGAFRRGEADVLIGTQMIAKGLDFPNVTLVGVLNADSSLNMPDFRAAERTYQLIAQVSGRAGRAELPGEVIIQSFDPSVPAIQYAARCDFTGFAAAELRDRKEGFFPPYCRLATVNLRSKDLKLVGDWADMYSKSLAKVKGLTVGEAMPGALEKAEGWYRWQIVLRAESVSVIVKAWRWIISQRVPPKDLRVVLDVDAFNLA
jgi:primosomal protein N' (replication factor Y)